jgi:thioredoxin-related protein
MPYFKREIGAPAGKRACTRRLLPIYFPGDGNHRKETGMLMRKITLVMITAAMIAGCGGGGTDGGGTGETNTWMSFDTGMELAKNMGRPVVIDFYTTWCRWCKVMDRDTFRDEKVASFLNEHFVSIKLNAEQTSTKISYGGRTYTPASLARAFRVRGYPSIAYLDEEGGLIFVDAGFKKPDQFMVNLKYVQTGCFRKGVSIDEFRRRGGKCD